MSQQTGCAQCGIRYAGDLDVCPWCGTPNPEGGHGRAGLAQPAATPAPGSADPAPPSPAERAGPADLIAANHAAAASQEPAHTPTAVAALPPASTEHPLPVARAAPVDTLPTPATAAPPRPPAPAGTAAASGTPGGAPSAAPQTPPPGSASAVTAAADPAPPRRARRIALNALAIVVLLVIGALIAEYAPIGPSRSSAVTTPTGAPEPTDPNPVLGTTTPAATDSPPDTTVPPPDTTVVASTTTSEAPPSTVPAIDPIGDPIAVSDLALGAVRLGELDIGSDGARIVGRLVASLGQPDDDTGVVTSGGEFGTCAGDTVRIVRFGSLAVINEVDGGGAETFAAYRVDLTYQEAASPADGLTTISGLTLGDTVADLNAVYAGFAISLDAGGGRPTFRLSNGSGELLLYGPISNVTPDGVIEGIYSPDACSG